MNMPANCLSQFEKELGTELVNAILNANQSDEAGIEAQRERVAELKNKLGEIQRHPRQRSGQPRR